MPHLLHPVRTSLLQVLAIAGLSLLTYILCAYRRVESPHRFKSEGDRRKAQGWAMRRFFSTSSSSTDTILSATDPTDTRLPRHRLLDLRMPQTLHGLAPILWLWLGLARPGKLRDWRMSICTLLPFSCYFSSSLSAPYSRQLVSMSVLQGKRESQ